MKRAFLAATLFVASSAGACINDRDTLAFELRNVDALKRVRSETNHRKKVEAAQEIALKAIGGRFERFPPKYYEMRIARLEAQPSMTAFEYDDLAVAYERLDKTDKAIEILLASKSMRKTKDDAYRFHANYGTFLVHKWLAQKDRSDTKALEQSIAEIKAALKINPNSHFGRESVQLDLERYWLRQTALAQSESIFKGESIDIVVGLAGIVIMGLAYELPDAYWLMSDHYLIGGAEESIFSQLASARAIELVRAGTKPVSSFIDIPTENSDIVKEVFEAFHKLRNDGENVHQARLAYIEERLNRGEHPDTHERFWKEWKEPPAPVLKRIPDPTREMENWLSIVAVSLVIIVLVAILGTIGWKVARRNVPKR